MCLYRRLWFLAGLPAQHCLRSWVGVKLGADIGLFVTLECCWIGPQWSTPAYKARSNHLWVFGSVFLEAIKTKT